MQVETLRGFLDKALEASERSKAFFTAKKLKNDFEKKVKLSRDFKDHPLLNHNNFVQLINKMYEDWLREKVVSGRLRNIGLDDSDIMRGVYATEKTLSNEMQCIRYAKTQNPELFCPAEVVEKELEKLPLISEEQRAAVYHVCYSKDSASIYEGYAGAGKSFTSVAIKNSYVSRGYDVMGLALSWQAAKVLGESGGISDVKAIAKFVIAFRVSQRTGVQFFKKDTLIIVDEAGLVDTASMSVILEAQKEAREKYGINVKVVLTGDSLQLLPVGAGAIFNTLIGHVGSSVIKTIRRQTQASQRDMVRLAFHRRSGEALHIMQRQENIVWADDIEQQEALMVRDYLSFRLAHPESSALLLAGTNAQVASLNKRVRSLYKSIGKLEGLEIKQRVSDGRMSWDENFQKGDEIVVRANYTDAPVYEMPKEETFDIKDYKVTDVGVFNRFKGDIAHIQPLSDGSFNLHIDMKGELKGRFVLNTYAHRDQDSGALPMHHNYALTIYSSQGQTVEKAFMALGNQSSFRLFGVGISRHKDDIQLYIDQKKIHNLIDTKVHKLKIDYDNTTIGRYSVHEQLGIVAEMAGKNEENLTAHDYMQKIRQPKKEEIEETELYRIRPPSEVAINDYDHSFLSVVPADVLTEEKRKTWWTELYVSSNSWGATPEKLEKMRLEGENEEPNFVAFKHKALKLSGVNEEHVIEPGDRIFTKRKSVRDPVLDVHKLILDNEDNYKEATLVSQGELKEQRKVEGIKGGIEKASVKTNKSNEIDLSLFQQPENPEANKFEGFSVMNLFEVLEKVEQAKAINNEGTYNENLYDLNEDKFDYKEIHRYTKPVVEEAPKKVKVPFLERPKDIMRLDIKGNIELLGDYKEENQVAFKEFAARNQNKIWEIGKYNEVRFLAKDKNGIVREAYDQHGHPMYGTNFPAVFPNYFRNEHTDIFVTKGTAEWLWASYSFMTRAAVNEIFNKYNRSPKRIKEEATQEELAQLAKTPDFVLWHEKLDFTPLRDKAQNRTFKLVRGYDEESELKQWAIDTQENMFSKFGIKAEIFPEIKGHKPSWELFEPELSERDLVAEMNALITTKEQGRQP